MAGTERQQEAITTHDSSLVVSAGAGTGKTYVLVNKYIHLLETFGEGETRSHNRLSVLNILALTFTEKAAAEMKERIRTELEKKEGDFWKRTRLEFLIAPVQTFHSFCASVLREFAFEAGLEPSFAVLDEQEFSRILTISFQDLIHTRAEGDEERALISTLSLIGASNLEKMVRYLYTRRDEAEQFFEHLTSDPQSLISNWQEQINRFREDEIRNIRSNQKFLSLVQNLIGFSSMNISGDDKAMVYLQYVRPLLEAMLDAITIEEFLKASSLFLNGRLGNSGSSKNWSSDVLNELRQTHKSLQEWLKNDIPVILSLEFTPGNPFHDQTLRFLGDLGIVFHKFCTNIDQKKAEAGGIDFTDLIRHTKHLFRTRRDLTASYYRERYRYILIDEFQDTDPAQLEIIAAIIGDPSPEVQGLFIVGDPKQSIYLFRDADVTRFRDARQFITGDCAGKEIPLDICFRSSPAVVTFVNYLFTRIFRTAEKPWEFTYDAIKVSDERTDHTGSVSLILIRDSDGILEYEVIANQIQKMIHDETRVYEEGSRDPDGNRTFTTRSACYGDIAILLERRTHLGLYIHALATRNIPYYVHKGTGFYNRQEILDLISLLSVLYRPYDDVHLIGLLKSPYFGLSDLDILRISRQTGRTFSEKLQRSGTAYPEYERVYTLLSGWQKRAGRFRLVPLIQLVLDESGVMAVYGGLTEGDQILSNLEKMLRIVRNREESGRYYLSELVTDLHDALEHEEQEGEAMIDDPGMDAVTIMTIHASKGLEFPIVFVPDMAAKPNLTQNPILMDGQRDLLGIILPDPENDFSLRNTPIYTLLKKGLDERLLAEKRRLLYVALTRSADHLIMSGTWGDDLPDGTKETRLDWIIPAIGLTERMIEEGSITLKSDDGRTVQVRIISPDSEDQAPAPEQPPFTIPPELVDCRGRFEITQLHRTQPVHMPFVVTSIVEWLNVHVSNGQMQPEGEGAIFGSAVHEVLRGREPGVIIREFAIEDEDQQAMLRSVSDNFRSLPILSGSSDIHWEQAFTMTIAGIPLTGRIDFIARLGDGSWIVIDYKSERVTAEELGQKESYRFQVEIYRRAAEILGMKPVRGALYSVSEKILVEVDPWSDEAIIQVLHQYTGSGEHPVSSV